MNSTEKYNPLLFRLVIAHYLTAACFFIALAVMLLYSSSDLGGHYFHPKLLAITHTAALGWGTLIIFGACYQLIPVLLETDLFSVNIAWFTLGCFIPGLVLLVYSFWIFDPGILMQLGSILLLSGILLFAINVFRTVINAKTNNIYQDFISTASIWLLATGILGLLMVYNFRYPFLPKIHLEFLKLHAHMGIGGWFLLLIIGVSGKLVPMFLVSRKQKVNYLKYSYYLINLALFFFLIDMYFAGFNWKTYVIAGLALAGVLFWQAHIFHCFRSRLKKRIDLPMWHSVVSFGLLGAAIFILPLIIYQQLANDPTAVRNTTLYGSLLFMGWITALILGQTFKTLPFIVWVRNYHLKVGKEEVPMPADLYNKTLIKAQFIAFILFILIFFPGLISNSPMLITIGLSCFFICGLLYISNVLITLIPKPKNESL